MALCTNLKHEEFINNLSYISDTCSGGAGDAPHPNFKMGRPFIDLGIHCRFRKKNSACAW